MMGTVKSAGAVCDPESGLLHISAEIPDNSYYSGINIVKCENQNRSDGNTSNNNFVAQERLDTRDDDITYNSDKSCNCVINDSLFSFLVSHQENNSAGCYE